MGVAGLGLWAWAAGYSQRAPRPMVIKQAFAACPAASAVASGTVAGQAAVSSEANSAAISAPFVASKRGKKYYPASCPAAASLSKANIIGFSSEEEARAAGYERSAGCR